ncbi:hypothetical protein [Kitasatospora sp. NPDC054795]
MRQLATVALPDPIATAARSGPTMTKELRVEGGRGGSGPGEVVAAGQARRARVEQQVVGVPEDRHAGSGGRGRAERELLQQLQVYGVTEQQQLGRLAVAMALLLVCELQG